MLSLNGFGKSDKARADCDYLNLEANEYISHIAFGYSADTIESITLAASNGGTFSKGNTGSAGLKVFELQRNAPLIGLKGVGSDSSLDSLGLILFDTSCDLSALPEKEEQGGQEEVIDEAEREVTESVTEDEQSN